MDNIAAYFKIAGGAVCSVFTYIWGGLDAVMAVLLWMMALDYLTGVMAACYTHTVSSEVGYRGILRKVAILAMIALAHLVGGMVGISEIRAFVIGFYIANEAISIAENAGNMGVKIPKRLLDVLAQLQDKDGGTD